MITLLQCVFISTLLLYTSSFKIEDQFITLNSSSSKYVISTSIATNIDKQFAIYCPVLINTKDSSAQFTASQQKKKLIIQPRFVQDNEFLYNDYSDGQYWYGFKKAIDPKDKDVVATFALAKLKINSKEHNFFLPLFNLPLSFLNFGNLYKCDDVLISYKKTDHNLYDVTIFSSKQGWSLMPQASWGFRNKDEDIYFSRQTYPLGTVIEVNVAENKYCVLNEELKQNTYNLEEKEIYTLNDLLIKYSRSLEVKDRNQQQLLQQQQSDGQL